MYKYGTHVWLQFRYKDTHTHTHLYTCIIIFVFKKFSHTSPPPSHGRCQLPLSSPRDRLIPYRTPSVMTPTQKLEPTHTCLLNPGHAYMHICLHIICIYTHTYTFTLKNAHIYIYTYSCLCSAFTCVFAVYTRTHTHTHLCTQCSGLHACTT